MINDKLQILVATKNLGKIKEMHELLAEFPFVLRSLSEFPHIPDVEETGATFADNAILKATDYAKQTNILALADDSGLEVIALGGAPGVFSARYAGKNATDAEKIVKLLDELKEKNDRRARFVCAMAISDKNGEIKFLGEGICNGEIALKPSGTNGFGYDPIFIPEGFNQSFGELSGNVKKKISHRAQAIMKIIQYLRDF